MKSRNIKIQNKDLKLKAIYYFLNAILNPEYPLEVRKKEMIRTGSRLNGFPEWSDLWGNVLRPIDVCSLSELRLLVGEIDDEYEHRLLEEMNSKV